MTSKLIRKAVSRFVNDTMGNALIINNQSSVEEILELIMSRIKIEKIREEAKSAGDEIRKQKRTTIIITFGVICFMTIILAVAHYLVWNANRRIIHINLYKIMYSVLYSIGFIIIIEISFFIFVSRKLQPISNEELYYVVINQLMKEVQNIRS